MYKMDRTVGKVIPDKEDEKEKLFPLEASLKQRLDEVWCLTCRAYNIDPKNPPKMDKTVGSSRKHAK